MVQSLNKFASWIKSFKYLRKNNLVLIHYHRRYADYDGWGLHVWGDVHTSTAWNAPMAPTGIDRYGIYWIVEVPEDAEKVNYVIHKGSEKDPGPDQALLLAKTGREVWLLQGHEEQFGKRKTALKAAKIRLKTAPTLQRNQAILYYRRRFEDYDGWGLHVWGDSLVETDWLHPLPQNGRDAYGVYWIVNLQPKAKELHYIIHKGDEKDPAINRTINFNTFGHTVYLIQNSHEQFTDPETAKEALIIAGIGDIKNKAQAHWLKREWIAWPTGYDENLLYRLTYDPQGGIKVTKNGLKGGQHFQLTWAGYTLPAALAEEFPHLSFSRALRVPAQFFDLVPDMLKGQCVLSVHQPDGKILSATALQIPGVLDDLYAHSARDAELGITWDGDMPTLQVWAPTAQSVCVKLSSDSERVATSPSMPMSYDPLTGIWQIAGQPDWNRQYFLYDVQVFMRQEGQIVHNLVTDPWSVSLAMDSTCSQIVNLNDAALKPPGWDKIVKHPLESPTDMVIYELHLRDFSACDKSIPEEQRGTYLAFTHFASYGMKHLKLLADAGLTHIHLLPVFDIASINEDKNTWKQVDFEALAQLPPASDQQQEAVQAIRDEDAYNWGYDPYHYTVPEGSYATNPQGATRILEFRAMVAALHAIGLRVIMDVVYNHTFAGGKDDKSVLDRLVPGYYHRLDHDGYIANSTCCANTATEHAMMEKLMLDSLTVWAKQYKIDGFRFDLMGHHMVENIQNARRKLDTLTPETDGVYGKQIYLYGEGWDFGEVACNARGRNASQGNMAGTGVGTFNDRLRDATRGGNPFGDMLEQGYLTGLYTQPNEAEAWPEEVRRAKLFELEDVIRMSLVANLADYRIMNAYGFVLRGDQLAYRGGPCGYTKSPQENVAYISAHDNETLFDVIQYKAPLALPSSERARMQQLGISLIMLGQGIPFFDSGIELLRSKSMDRDSYNSGDWYNHLDYSYQTSNWGIGMPLYDVNKANLHLIRPRLLNPLLSPDMGDILATRNHFIEMLQIRKSSPLFRLRTAEEVCQRVRFFNTGPGHIPGLIVMAIDDNAPFPDLDLQVDLIVVFFNAENTPVRYTFCELENADLYPHPIQANSLDPVVRAASIKSDRYTFIIPGRTTAVFIGKGKLHAHQSPAF
ncbi:MAG: pullulanase-type alpha-1,6-glucosidase [Chloroflexota bacterium]